MNYLTLHHSAIRGNAPQLEKINASHKLRGFPQSSMGFYVGYHCLIEKTGIAHWTRRPEEIGAHTFGWNDKAIGICLAGDFTKEQPTMPQLEKLNGIINSLKSKYNIPDENVKHHWELRPTACPGIDLKALISPSKRWKEEKNDYDHLDGESSTKGLQSPNLREHTLHRLLRRLLKRGDVERFWRVKRRASI